VEFVWCITVFLIFLASSSPPLSVCVSLGDTPSLSIAGWLYTMSFAAQLLSLSSLHLARAFRRAASQDCGWCCTDALLPTPGVAWSGREAWARAS
jgi:hypothetical protein